MTKLEKLDVLDNLVLDKMISLMQEDQLDLIGELGSAIAYLKANQVTEDKKTKDNDPVEARKAKLKEAEARRKADSEVR
jgi:hypothetical protein